MLDDPWERFSSAPKNKHIRARRIPKVGTESWGIYWGIDYKNQCLLILQHNSDLRKVAGIPAIRGLSIEEVNDQDENLSKIIIRLIDNEQREVFKSFCSDVVEATKYSSCSSEAVNKFLIRTFSWHRLLKTGQNGKLSHSEQKGLIGELLVLDKCLLDTVDANTAITSWTGPFGSNKDFDLGLVQIESKARSPQRSEIVISSVDQLDVSDISRLFLRVVEVGSASVDSYSTTTISELATDVRKRIEKSDVFAAYLFDQHIAGTGFEWDDDYSNDRWSVGEEVLYEVVDSFPRLIPKMVPAAINDLCYSLRISDCENYRVSSRTLVDAIS